MTDTLQIVEIDDDDGADARPWLLVVAMFVASAALVTTAGPTAEPIVDVDVPVVAIFLGFVLGEFAMVRLHFRSEAHEFNLVDAPLVFALFTTSPVWAVVAAMTAAAVVRAVRRQQLQKALFNIGLAGVEVALAITVARWIAPAHVIEIGPREWVATLVGTGVATVVSSALVHAVIMMTEGARPENRTLRGLGPSLGITAATVSLALGAFSVAVSDPLAGMLWIAPLGMLFVSYRAYLAHLEESGRLAFIARFTTAMASAPDAEAALHTLLRHVCDETGAEAVEAIVFADELRSEPMVARLSTTGFALTSDADHVPVLSVREYATGCGEGEIIRDTGAHSRLAAYLEGAGFADAIVVPLVHDDHPLGLLVIANRCGDVATWGIDDHELMIAVAHSTSVILHSGALTTALDDAVRAGARLLDETRVDPLTTLVNRRGLTSAVEAAAAAELCVAAIYLDLNDFKAVNDTHGHAAGDAVLRAIGRRLDGITRQGELAARVGGDEFVVLLAPAPDRVTIDAIASRLARAIAEPIAVGDLVIRVTASLGISTGPAHADVDSLFARADAAMYEAKRAATTQDGDVITLR